MICVDSSVAVKWVLEELHTDKAEALYVEAADSDDFVVAPRLLPFEVTNVIRQRMRREGLPPLDAEAILDTFLAFSVELLNPVGLHGRALQVASSFGLHATYDAHYIALAQMLRCVLWTDDQRLLRTLSGRLPFVRWIGDYRPTA